MKINKKSGFSVVELLVVVAIVIMLAAIAIPNFAAAQKKHQAALRKVDPSDLGNQQNAKAVDVHEIKLPGNFPAVVNYGNDVYYFPTTGVVFHNQLSAFLGQYKDMEVATIFPDMVVQHADAAEQYRYGQYVGFTVLLRAKSK